MLELKKINRQNVWQVARLKVKRTQVDYVASNIESILEAFATREEWRRCRTVCASTTARRLSALR
ncbi:MAG: hypothetical protein ACLUHE_09115 [Christensenellales bacterium]